MSSADVFYGIKDVSYWLFENTLEPIGDNFWKAALVFGFLAFAYWMRLQSTYNKAAENNPDQRK
jgi:hypothetical protein